MSCKLVYRTLRIAHPAVYGADIVESLDLWIHVPDYLLLKVRLLNLQSKGKHSIIVMGL